MRVKVCMLLAVLLCSCTQVPELTVLRVAVSSEEAYPYSGLEADIAEALAEGLGIPAEFTPYARDDIPAVLESGAADIGFGCFTHSDRLLETNVYFTKRQFVLTNRGEYYIDEEAELYDEFAAAAAVKESGETLQALLKPNGTETALVGLVADSRLLALLDIELASLLNSGKIAELAAKYM